MPEMQVSHICIQRAENSICYVVCRTFSGMGWGEVVPYIIGCYFNTYYRNFRSFTRTADYPHRPIIAYGEKKGHQITRTGG